MNYQSAMYCCQGKAIPDVIGEGFPVIRGNRGTEVWRKWKRLCGTDTNVQNE